MAIRLEHCDFGEGTVNVSLFVHPPILTVETQETLFTYDVSFTATVSAIFLLHGVKSVIHAMVTWFVSVRIHPSTSLAVPAPFLLWLFGHFVFWVWDG